MKTILKQLESLGQICNHECSEEIILNNQTKGLLINKLLTAVFHSVS